MAIEDLQRRVATRVQAIVCRGGRILMAQHQERGMIYWCLPGGALEAGETPEAGALRELREEACVDGRVVRQTGCSLDDQGRIVAHTFLVDIGGQEPTLGHDPEVGADAPILVDLQWMALDEIPERDRAFLWRAGLLNVSGFLKEIEGWGDGISYPE
ncbi:MAG: NUDIX hydrolase [Candidatus Bipolaricaulia bacterium]